MKTRRMRTQMSLVRMDRLLVLRRMRLGLDTVLADIAKDRALLEAFAH